MTTPIPESHDPRDKALDVSDAARDLSAKTGRSAMTVLLFAGAKLLVALGSMALLARLVTPAEQGIVAMALPAVLIASGLSEFGLAQAIVQRPHITHRLASTLLWVSALLGLGLTLGTVLLAGPAARFYDTPEVYLLLVMMSLYILFSALTSLYVGILRRRMQIRKIEAGSFMASLIASALAVLAAWLGAGYWALAIQLVFAEAFNLVYLIAVSRWIPSGPLSCRFGEASSALKFGGYLAGERLLGEFARNIQIIFIGRMFTQVDAGFVYRSQMIAQMPQRRVVAPLSGAFIPSLSRLHTDAAEFCAMYERQVTRGNFLLVALGLIICSCADALVQIMLGPAWAGAAPVLAWLGLLPMTGLTLSSFSWALVACGRGKEMFIFRLIGTALLAVALLVGAQFGIMTLVAIYALTQTFGQGLVLAAMVVHFTPLTLTTLRRALLGETLFAAALGAALLSIRQILTLDSALLEALVVLAAMSVVYIMRLIFDRGLRADVVKVFRIRRR